MKHISLQLKACVLYLLSFTEKKNISKIIKSAFCFISKALFVLKVFNFL